MAKYLDSNGLAYLWGKMKSYVDSVIQSVGAITGVKGDAESTYRTGNVNLTAANIGAATSSHTHAASDVESGTLDIGRIPTGTGASQVALGNHTHDYTKTRVKGDAESSYRTDDVNLTPANIGALPLSGGTLTGALTVKGATIYTQNTNSSFDRDGSNPSSALYGSGLTIYDKDGERVGFIRANRLTDGTMQVALTVCNEDTSGTEVSNYLILNINRSGTRSYTVGDSAAFRSAIGAAPSSHTHTASDVSGIVKKTTHSASGVTIAGGANYYANFGSATAESGYVPVAAVFNLASMSNYTNLVAGSIQTNGTYIWSRVYNSGSASSTGSWSATVYWLPAP